MILSRISFTILGKIGSWNVVTMLFKFATIVYV